MALKELLEKWYEDESYPPDGEDLGVSIEQVAYERNGGLRWGESITVVYTDGTEFWAVQDVEPATENQSWGDYGKPSIIQVEPYEVTTVAYRKIT
jgi:hypothetical protein